MDLYESNTHPFVVKIWLEQSVDQGGHATWRGRITHVPTGRYRYIDHLDDIGRFITPYLERMGIDVRTRFEFRQWLRRWMRNLMA